MNGRQMTGRTALLGWALLGGLCVPAVEGGGAAVPEDWPDEFKQAALDLVGTANAFRLVAGANVAKAAKSWCTPGSQAKWDQFITPTARKQELVWNDFFAQTVLWPGRVGPEHGIAVLYNPWSDALMVTAWKGKGSALKLVDFVLITGETWRGEALGEKSGLPVWTRAESDVRAALARQYQATQDVFSESYPLQGGLELLPEKVRARLTNPPAVEWTWIEVRLLHRIEMYQRLLLPGAAAQEKAVLGKVNELRAALAKGDRDQIQALFPKEQDQAVVKNAALLPQDARRGLQPVFYNRRDREALLVLSSSLWPRWYLTVSLSCGANDAKLNFMHVCDFELSRMFLAAGTSGEAKP